MSGPYADACWDRNDWSCCPLSYRIYRRVRVRPFKYRRVNISEDLLNRTAIIDHINHDVWDNRIENLRVCSESQNCANRRKKNAAVSRYKGVTRHRDKWKARVKCNGQELYLGLFDTEIGAAVAYNNKAKELFGDFAILNKV